jgi:hypothetical protein
MTCLALFSIQGEAHEVKHDRKVKIIIFKGEREGYYVKVGYGTATFKGVKGGVFTPKGSELICIGKKHPFTPTLGMLIKPVKHALKAQVAHGIVVGVGIHQGHAQT